MDILAYSVFLSAIGSILKLISILTDDASGRLQTAALILVFASLVLMVLMIAALIIMGIRRGKGHQIPNWLQPSLSVIWGGPSPAELPIIKPETPLWASMSGPRGIRANLWLRATPIVTGTTH